MEATGVHRAQTALHVRHDLVLGLAHEQREDEEGSEDPHRAEHDLERLAHRGPHSGPGTPGACTRRRPPVVLVCSPSPGSLAPGHGFEARGQDEGLAQGGALEAIGQQERSQSESGAVVEAREVDAEHLVGLALVPGSAGEDTVMLGTAAPSGTRVRSRMRRSAPGVEPSMRWQTTSKPGFSSASLSSTAVSQSKNVYAASRASATAVAQSARGTSRRSSVPASAMGGCLPIRGRPADQAPREPRRR